MSKKDQDQNDGLKDANKLLTETIETQSAEIEKAEISANELKVQLDEANSKLAKAKDQITSFTKYDDAQNHQVGQDQDVKFAKVDPEFEHQRILPATVDTPAFRAKMVMREFFEEPVTIRIDKTSEKNADQTFFISVNGEKEYFHRGQTKTVKRYIVEQLIRSKPINYEQRYDKNQVAGEDEYILESRSGLKYPFSIVEDANKKYGSSWYEATLAQA